MIGFGSRAGLYLRDDLMTVVVAAGTRKPVQSFSLEPGESPGTHLSTELDSRKISLRRVRVGLARPLVTVKTLE